MMAEGTLGCKANSFAILEKLKGGVWNGSEKGCVAMSIRGSREIFIKNNGKIKKRGHISTEPPALPLFY